MILPDINLLVHAHDSDSPRHERARKWWDECLAGSEGVALAWVVILGFVRITTHGKILLRPLPPKEACDRVAEWLSLPHFQTIEPRLGHFGRVQSFLTRLGAAGNLTTDAHLAALAIERGLILQTTDADFTRFAGLKWKNPLKN